MLDQSKKDFIMKNELLNKNGVKSRLINYMSMYFSYISFQISVTTPTTSTA
jgi:hypothetical protein